MSVGRLKTNAEPGSGEGFLYGVADLPGLVPALLLPHRGAGGGRIAATVSHAYQQ